VSLIAILNQIPGTISGGLAVTTSTAVAFVSYSTAGVKTTNTITASASGGAGGYTYAWTYVGGNTPPLPTHSTSAATAWTATVVSPNINWFATWLVTVTDSSANTATAYVTVEFNGTS
jgi:hypothetical protein